FSVYNDEADGLREAYSVLKQLGYHPVPLTRPIQNTRHRGLLILVEPQKSGVMPGDSDALAEAEAKSVLHWVEQGNTLLLSARHTTPLHRELHVAVTAPGEDVPESPAAAEVAEAGGYTAQIDSLSSDRFTTLQAHDGLPLWQVDGKTGAVLLRRGAGRVIVVADPTLLTARGLGRDDNVMFLVNVARLDSRDGVVYFDEYHHGFRSTGGFWGYLGYHGAQLALVPILLVVLAAAWHTMLR